MTARIIAVIGMVIMGIASSYGEAVKSQQDMKWIKRAGNSKGWFVVNDGVMGGISQSRAVLT